jgi:DNA polymerase-3 subunit epsilon
MDLDMDEIGLDGQGGQTKIADIILLAPMQAELAAHEVVLKSLDKEVKGTCLWRQLTAD